jgi:hypothetical protein
VNKRRFLLDQLGTSIVILVGLSILYNLRIGLIFGLGLVCSAGFIFGTARITGLIGREAREIPMKDWLLAFVGLQLKLPLLFVAIKSTKFLSSVETYSFFGGVLLVYSSLGAWGILEGNSSQV